MRIPVGPATLIAVASLTAAGCSKSTTTISTNVDGNTTSTTTTTTGIPNAVSLGIQPGKWETTISVLDTKMSGMPAGMVVPPSAPTKLTSCITPEQAAKGPGDFLKATGGECTVTSSNYGGGKIDVAMTCKMPMGTLTTKSTGTYSATSMTSDAISAMTGKVSMSSRIHTEAHRVGECGS